MVLVGAGGGGDEEDEGGRSVGGAEVDAGGAAAEGEGGFGDVGAAAVGYADAAFEAGGHLFLAGGDVGEEAVEVGDASGGGHPAGEGAGRLVLGGGGAVEVEVHQISGDQGVFISWLHRGGGRGGRRW